MRKSFKALVWLLAVLMVISVIPAFTINAEESYKFLLVNNAEDTSNWTQHVGGWPKSVDYDNYVQGSGSMKFINTDPSKNIGTTFKFMSVLTTDTVVSINDYPNFEIFFKGSSTRTGQIQVNYALNKQDGRNHAPGFTIGTEWSRYSKVISTQSISSANADSENNTLINTFRISILGSELAQDYVLNLDGALLYDDAFATARSEKATEIQALIDGAVTTKQVIEAYNAVKEADEQFPNIRYFLTGLDDLTAKYETANEAVTNSPYVEVAHWGIPCLTGLQLSGGTVYGVTGGRSEWGTLGGMGLISTGGSGNVASRGVDEQYDVLAYSKVNLINCSALWFPFNPVSYGIAAGEEYTVVGKVATADLNSGMNAVTNTPLQHQLNGNLIGVAAGNNYNGYLSVAGYDAAPSKIDPVYGYEYKEVTCTAVSSDASVNISGEAPAHASGTDFDIFDFFYGFEIYNKDGVKVLDKPTSELYVQSDSTFYGCDWGAQWVVNSGYTWNKATGGGYGVYVGNDVLSTYGASIYAMEYTCKVSDIVDPTKAVATFAVNCPDTVGSVASRKLLGSEAIEGQFVTYTVYFELDPSKNTSRVEPTFSISDNAVVSMTNIKLSKLSIAQSAVAEIIFDIDSYSNTIVTSDIASIEATRTAYDALSDVDKARVYNYEKFIDVEEKAALIKNAYQGIVSDTSTEFVQAEAALNTQIDGIMNDDTLDDTQKAEAVEAANKAFKFKNGVLNVKFQGAATDDALRLVSTIDNSYADYVKAGFIVSVDGGAEFKIESNEVYESITAKQDGIAYDKVASETFADTSEAFITATIAGIPSSAMSSTITVKAFVEDSEGNITYGLAKTRTISQFFN